MNLSQPIEAVIPTLDGPVLQALGSTTAPVTGRHVHRMAGTGSEAGVRKVLGRLVEQGLVHVNEAGASLLYVANREHLAWPAVESLAGLRRLLLARIEAAVSDWETKPLHASLFGSAARGDGDVRSDIDLFVIRPARTAEDSEPWAGQVDRLRQAVHAWTGNPCQVFQLDVDRLAEHVAASDHLVDQWRRDAITLYGGEPRDLISRAKRQASRGNDRAPTGGAPGKARTR